MAQVFGVVVVINVSIRVVVVESSSSRFSTTKSVVGSFVLRRFLRLSRRRRCRRRRRVLLPLCRVVPASYVSPYVASLVVVVRWALLHRPRRRRVLFSSPFPADNLQADLTTSVKSWNDTWREED